MRSVTPMDFASAAPLADDRLFMLQLEVARRADALVRSGSSKPGLNLHCWLVAEHEIVPKALAEWADEPAAMATCRDAVGGSGSQPPFSA